MPDNSKTTGWRPIEAAPKKDEVLFYFPDTKSGRSSIPKMMKVGRLCDLSFRQPTHWRHIVNPTLGPFYGRRTTQASSIATPMRCQTADVRITRA